MDKKMQKYAYIAGAVLVIYIIFKISGGFIWFLFQTLIYGVLFLALLLFLKKKGFFNS